MKKCSFILVGCGRIGKRHAEEISRVGTLVAVCDTDIGKARCFGEQYNVPFFGSLNETLKSGLITDFASICTPNGLHASQTIACFNHGLHVICEKPMAIKSEDCRTMIREATKMKRKLFVVKQNRFNPPVLAAKKKIDEGAFGKIFNMQLNCFWNREPTYYDDPWRGTIDMDGGTLFTQFSHFIDLMYWFMGDVAEVRVLRKNFTHKDVIAFEDTGVVVLEFSSGAIGTINYTVNAYAKNMEGSLTLFGENATIKIGGEYLNRIDYAEGVQLDVTGDTTLPNDYGSYKGSMSNHDKVYDHILDVMNNPVLEILSVYDAMKTVEIIERVYEVGS